MLNLKPATPLRIAWWPRKALVLISLLVAVTFFNTFRTLYVLQQRTPNFFDFRSARRTPFVPSNLSDFEFTLTADSVGNFPLIGKPVKWVSLDNSNVFDVGGQHGVNDIYSEAFNLAILRLPPGSAWTFVGTARVRERRQGYKDDKGFNLWRQNIVAFGLNITSSGQLKIVTPGRILDIPMVPNSHCHGILRFQPFGAEDSRLFWTDAGTPAMLLGAGGVADGQCRVMAFVPDMRALFTELDDAIKVGGMIKAFEGRSEPGESLAGMRELQRVSGNRPVEKNWVSFYPGPLPNSSTLYPNIRYSLAPDEILHMTEKEPKRLWYHMPTAPRSDLTGNCVSRHHPHGGDKALHHASPLYRLTMCKRGCTPTEENTVYLAMGHITLWPKYWKFSVVYSTTASYAPISVGPIFQIPGLDDNASINYILTLQPIIDADLDDTLPQGFFRKDTMPDHFFVDDKILMTMGHGDRSMMSTIITMEDILGGHRSCADNDEVPT